MLSYETAVKLKEAGFPQFHYKIWDLFYTKSGDLLLTSDQIGPLRDKKGLMISHQHFFKCPTLSELIEKCGGRIIKLWILADGRSGVQLEGEPLADIEYYSCPEEAVANFWLTINKK